MRTTITIDDALFEEASGVLDETNVSSVITKALELLVASESKKRLLRLSGKAPSFSVPSRDSRSSDIDYKDLTFVAEEPTD